MTPRTTTTTETQARGLLTAIFLFSIYAATLLWATGGFLARAEGVAHWSFALAVATNVCLLPVAARWLGTPLRRAAGALGLALLVYAACCLLAAFFFDISHDGQTYHAQGILLLAAGWNPVYDTLPAALPHALWVQHYSKGYEYVAYGIYTITGKLESGKGLNGVLVVAAALVLQNAALPYLQNLRSWKRRVLMALAALNPIAVFTLFTFYVDGQLASCILVLLAAAEIFRRAPRVGSVLIFLSLVVLAQLKFTALVYAVLAAAGGGVFLLAYARQRVLSYAVLCLLTGALAVGLVGYNPYVRNISERGHPFYPLMGEGAIRIWSGPSLPPSFEHKSNMRKFAEVSFARSRNMHGAAVAPDPELKIPFTFDIKEWTVFKSHDVRIGGFGPLWSGVLMLSTLSAVLAGLSLRTRRRELRAFLGGIALLLGMTLIIPECWNLRYVPQLWWLPLWIAAFSLRFGGRLARAVAMGVLATMSINLAGTSAVSLGSDAVLSSEVRSQLAWLRRQPQPVKVPPHVFVASTARLNEADIKWQALPTEADTPRLAPTHRSLTLQNSQTKVFYEGPPYKSGPLFARLARYISPAASTGR